MVMIDTVNHTVKTPYFRLKQGIDLCGITCPQMVFKRKGADYDQDYLAAYMGAYVSEEHKDTYSPVLRARTLPKIKYIDPKTRKSAKKDDARVGFLFDRYKDKRVQDKIKRLGLEILVYHPSDLGLIKVVSDISEIENEDIEGVSQFIAENLDAGNDVMMNYRWDNFRGTENGHYVLIAAYNENNHSVTVVDPSPFAPSNGYWSENLKKFLYGMQPIWKEDDGKKRERGFVIFKGPQKLKKVEGVEPPDLTKRAPMYRPVVYKIEKQDINPKDYPKPNQS